MKLSRSLLALSVFAVALGAQAAPATGSLGGGSGTFLTLAGPGTLGSGGTLSGLDAGVDLGGTVFTSDHPTFAAMPTGTVGAFLAAGPATNDGGAATMTFTTGLKEISFLWGSPDVYNLLTVGSSDGSSATFTAAGMGFAVTNGNQGFAQYVTFVAAAGTTITSLMFNNLPNEAAFEVSNFNVTPVPEPETYALILAGLVAIGFITRRRRNH
jgi:hypothetical protein